MTLAELHAVIGICLPAQLPRIAPLLALVPLLAQRERMSIDEVYAMPAALAFGALVAAFGEFVHGGMIDDAQAVMACAESALDAERMRELLTARAG